MLHVAGGVQVFAGVGLLHHALPGQIPTPKPCLGPAWARDDMMTRASHAVLLLNYNF